MSLLFIALDEALESHQEIIGTIMIMDGALSWGKACEEMVELSWLWMGPYHGVRYVKKLWNYNGHG